MTENNRLDQSFGPVGTWAGLILFAVGIIVAFSHITGVILVLLGAFVGFTHTGTFIDYDKKRVRFSNNIFGIIKTGQWLDIDPSMKIGIRESKVTWRSYSRGNRSLDIENKDYRVILLDSGNNEIMPVKKCSTLDSAKIDRENIGSRLGLRSC